ncbi:hypothetical protein AB0I84_40060 [Streptomyces spectabilis]|uniref:hypothetical protein n=1 Tax=Streptomyces spectabilis TaxID=68270 RepID=UPI0033ED83C7
MQVDEQEAVQLVEDTGLLPVIQTPPSGLFGADLRLQQRMLPRGTAEQDGQDALQAQPVSHRTRPRRTLGPARQQRLTRVHKWTSAIHGRVVTHHEWPDRHIRHA